MLSPRHRGSRGTDTSRQARATRAISRASPPVRHVRSTSIGAREVELAVSKEACGLLGRGTRGSGARLLPLGAQLRVVEVDPHDAASPSRSAHST